MNLGACKYGQMQNVVDALQEVNVEIMTTIQWTNMHRNVFMLLTNLYFETISDSEAPIKILGYKQTLQYNTFYFVLSLYSLEFSKLS